MIVVHVLPPIPSLCWILNITFLHAFLLLSVCYFESHATTFTICYMASSPLSCKLSKAFFFSFSFFLTFLGKQKKLGGGVMQMHVPCESKLKVC